MKNINQYLSDSISKWPERVLLVEQRTGEQLTFRAFGEQLGRVAVLLREAGVGAGDIVTLVSQNSLDLVVMLYGVIAYGAVAKPLNPQLTPTEIERLLEHSGSRLVFADRELALGAYAGASLPMAAYREAAPGATDSLLTKAQGERAGALLIYTSGTTGNPKGIILTQRNIIHNVLTAIEKFSLDEGHTALCLLPLFHMFGFISDLSTMIFCGGRTVIMETFDLSMLGLVAAALVEHGVNSFSAVPLIFELMLRFDCGLDVPTMRFCVSGAAPLKRETAAEFLRRYGFPIVPAYGLTESTCFATISPPARIRAGSIGLPAGSSIRVVSEAGEPLGAGHIGELLISGASVMEGGYFRGADDCFQGPGRDWFKTGDLGYYDADGYFYITGRKKNMVIRGGEKLYLEDLDACLGQCAQVADSATVAFDADGEERVACFVVAGEAGGLGAREVLGYLRERVGELKCPDEIIFLDKIPRTATNKTRIRELQQLAEARALAVR